MMYSWRAKQIQHTFGEYSLIMIAGHGELGNPTHQAVQGGTEYPLLHIHSPNL